MYLKDLRVVNDGPLADLSLALQVPETGPKPLVLVGENGAGKTNLLSVIADAVVEGAALHHSDVLTTGSGISRNWLRIVGGATTRRGQAGGFAILRFSDEERSHFYLSKAGDFPVEMVPADLADSLRPAASWAAVGSVKEFRLSEDDSRRIYSSGCYAYFPTSRSEIPHWLNNDSLQPQRFTVPSRVTGRLDKPLYVEQGLGRLSEWISGIIADSRLEAVAAIEDGQVRWTATADGRPLLTLLGPRQLINEALRIILDDPGAEFVWQSRFIGLGFSSPKTGVVLPLAALSGGQATLLSIFGTILSQCDSATGGQPALAQGICLVDEIDAHVHVDLAYRAIPRLMKLLPRVQFITSAHSPMYILGMQAAFGDEGFQLLELPGGLAVSPEAYGEFKEALKVLQETRGFDAVVAQRATALQQPIVLCEGETDPRYLRTAAVLLGRADELENLELDWIGRRGSSGAAVGSGKDSLNRAYHLLTQNPQLTSRPTLLLYDNDAPSVGADAEKIYTRRLPTNATNTVIRNGIENLLPSEVFTADMYQETVNDNGSGKKVTVRQLNKAALCSHLCDLKRDPSNFMQFSVALDIISDWRHTLTSQAPAPDDL